MKLEQLKSEAREKYNLLPNFKTLPKESQEAILDNNDTLVTIAFNAGLERAVEVVEILTRDISESDFIGDGRKKWEA